MAQLNSTNITGNLSVTGTTVSAKIIKNGGTSDDILLGDGSVASLSQYVKTGDIPTVNNGTLTIQQNGTSVGTFTADQSGNTTANITVPTKASDIDALPISGGTVNGNLTLYADSGNSPRLTFQRGTLDNDLNDWSLYDTGGYLHIQQRGSGSTDWEPRAVFTQSGVNFVGTISESGTALSSKYAKVSDIPTVPTFNFSNGVLTITT